MSHIRKWSTMKINLRSQHVSTSSKGPQSTSVTSPSYPNRPRSHLYIRTPNAETDWSRNPIRNSNSTHDKLQNPQRLDREREMVLHISTPRERGPPRKFISDSDPDLLPTTLSSVRVEKWWTLTGRTETSTRYDKRPWRVTPDGDLLCVSIVVIDDTRDRGTKQRLTEVDQSGTAMELVRNTSLWLHPKDPS